MSKIQTKTALERQIPEFIREDYAAFVNFVKAYYEFLEQSQSRNLSDIRSIDRTLDEFVYKFRKEVASLLPTSNIQNERFFLEKIREFYNIRGSVESYKLLFRLLYNKDVDVFYPSTQILKVSDGKWTQEKSVFVRTISGNVSDLNGQIINITTNKKVLDVFSPNVINYRENVYEVFIDKAYVNDISIGDTVSYGTARAEIIACPAKYNIVSGGSGFSVGAIYNLPTATGNGSTIKITGIGTNGAITRIQVISFGLDYDTNFYAKLSNKTNQALAYYHPITQYIAGTPRDPLLEPTETYGSPDENPPSEDGISDYVNFGYFINQDYMFFDPGYIPVNYNPGFAIPSDMLETNWYADTTYVGDIIASFYTNEGGVVVDETTAEIKVTLGPVALYPGYYATNDGFVSDESYIQDGDYYQLFSYAVKVEEQLDSYKDIVKSLLHPAGLKLFGQYNISANFDVVAIPLQAFIRRQYQDYIQDMYVEQVMDIDKIKVDTVDRFIEYVSKGISKPLSDSFDDVLDGMNPTFNKLLDWDYVPANVDPEDEEAYKQYVTLSHDDELGIEKYSGGRYAEIIADIVEEQAKDLTRPDLLDDILPVEEYSNAISKDLEWDYVPANVDPEDEEAYKQYVVFEEDSYSNTVDKAHTETITIDFDDLVNIVKAADKIIPEGEDLVTLEHTATEKSFDSAIEDSAVIIDPNTLAWQFSSQEGGSFFKVVTVGEESFEYLVQYERNLDDIVLASTEEFFLTTSYERSIADTSTPVDTYLGEVSFNRDFSDSIDTFLETLTIGILYERIYEDFVSSFLVESIINHGKNISDSTDIGEEVQSKEVTTLAADIINNITDSGVAKESESVMADSINTIEDSGVLYNNPYNTSVYTLGETDYFSESYAELTTTNF